MSTENKVKFLVIRFSSIGDIVLTTPVIRNLKEQVEHAEVHYLTKEAFAPILESNPYIDKLYLLTKDFNGLMRQLKGENYDYIIDLHRNLRTSRVRRALKRVSFQFNKLNREKWLLVNFKINKMPDLHIVDRYMKTILPFIEKPDEKGLDYFIPKHDVFVPSAEKNYVAVVVGANHFTKQMPDEKLVRLCNSINKPIVLLGGKADIEKAELIEKGMGKSCENLTGKLTINQSASVIKGADWVLTPDTGMMHIAAAFKKKIISYWGNTVPKFGMTAYQPDPASQIFEINDLKCRPCSKIGFKKCPKGHFKCMEQIDASKIAALANQ
jgi:ADP-heptose:LPS heptosyltransferase